MLRRRRSYFGIKTIIFTKEHHSLSLLIIQLATNCKHTVLLERRESLPNTQLRKLGGMHLHWGGAY